MIASRRVVMLLNSLPVRVFLDVLFIIYRDRLEFSVSFHDRDVALRVINIREPRINDAPSMFERKVEIIDEVKRAAIFVRFNLFQRDTTLLVDALRGCRKIASTARCSNR